MSNPGVGQHLSQGSGGGSRSALRRLNGMGGGGGGGKAVRLSSRLAKGGSAQAFVKIVRKGGTRTAGAVKAQMDYLTRDGEIEAQRSERYGGAVMDEGEQEQLAASWAEAPPKNGDQDLTTHFVVSFPAGTNAVDAEGASRAWADELFNSGNHGEVFNYYSVFHTDRPHPHMHVVVNRRGLENDIWLKVSKRGEINYDILRDVQVNTALPYGIDLEATPRLARGLQDLPTTDVEYRRAEREGREPKPREHSERSARFAAASIFTYAEQIEHDGAAMREHSPLIADRMQKIAGSLKDGLTLEDVFSQDLDRTADAGEFAGLDQVLTETRNEVSDGFKHIDELAAALPPGSVQRATIERDTAEWRGRVAPFIAGSDGFAEQVLPDGAGRYRGFAVDEGDKEGQLIKSTADALVRSEAESAGLNPDLMLARYNGNTAVPSALADRWRKMEQLEYNRADADEDRALQAVPSEHYARVEGIYKNARTHLGEIRFADRELDPDNINLNPQAGASTGDTAANAPAVQAASGGHDAMEDTPDRRGTKRARSDGEQAGDDWQRNIKQRLLENIPEQPPEGTRRDVSAQRFAIISDVNAGNFGSPGTIERRHAMMRDVFSAEELRTVRQGDYSPLRALTNDTNQINIIANQYKTAFEALADAGAPRDRASAPVQDSAPVSPEDRAAAQTHVLADFRAGTFDAPGGIERRFNLMRTAYAPEDLDAIQKGDYSPLRNLTDNMSEINIIANQHKVATQTMGEAGVIYNRTSALEEIRTNARDGLPNTPEAQAHTLNLMRTAYTSDELKQIERGSQAPLYEIPEMQQVLDTISDQYKVALAAETRQILNNSGPAREAARDEIRDDAGASATNGLTPVQRDERGASSDEQAAPMSVADRIRALEGNSGAYRTNDGYESTTSDESDRASSTGSVSSYGDAMETGNTDRARDADGLPRDIAGLGITGLGTTPSAPTPMDIDPRQAPRSTAGDDAMQVDTQVDRQVDTPTSVADRVRDINMQTGERPRDTGYDSDTESSSSSSSASSRASSDRMETRTQGSDRDVDALTRGIGALDVDKDGKVANARRGDDNSDSGSSTSSSSSSSASSTSSKASSDRMDTRTPGSTRDVDALIRDIDALALRESAVAARERTQDRQTTRVQASVNSEQASQRRRTELLKTDRSRSNDRMDQSDH